MIKYVNFILTHPDAKVPMKKYKGDAGWDLFVSRPCLIEPGQTMDIHTDIKTNMPPFVFARIIGRSSTLRKHNLIVNEGIIDNEYTGELFLCVRNMSSDRPFEVKTGMRLGQIIFHRIEDLRWAEVRPNDFRDTQRGSAGFGSTGDFDIDTTFDGGLDSGKDE